MKRVLVVFTLLFVMIPAVYANAAMPERFRDTNYYKNLNNYVEGTLKSNKNKAATAAQKKQYNTKVTNLATAAFNGILSREANRREAAKKQVDSGFAAATQAEKALLDATISRIQAEFDTVVQEFDEELISARKDAQDEYGDEILYFRNSVQSSKSRMKALKRKAKTRAKRAKRSKGKAKRKHLRVRRKAALKARQLKTAVKHNKKKLKRLNAEMNETIASAEEARRAGVVAAEKSRDEEIAEAQRDFVVDTADIKADFDDYLVELYDMINDQSADDREVVRTVRDRGRDLIAKMPLKK